MDVRELAVLARIRLSEEEVARIGAELERIVRYVDKLQALDTTGVEPMTHAVPMDLPLREDEAAPSFTADEAVGGAPAREEDFFVVPKAVDR